jgi:hypothetical protein
MQLKLYHGACALISITLLTTACSPINSMAPFDDQQAAIVARDMMPSPLAKRHQLPIERKAKQGTNKNDDSSET